MRTLTLLAAAVTSAQVADALKVALDRGWTPTLIAKHGSAQVRHALKGKPVSATGKMQPVASQPRTVKYAAKPPKRPKLGAGRTVTLTHTDGTVLVGDFKVSDARPKLRGTGTTHDWSILSAEGQSGGSITPAALARLNAGNGTHLPHADKMWLVTLR